METPDAKQYGTLRRGHMTGYSEEPEERWEAGGERFLIRPICAADAAEHNAFFHRLSPEDIRLRFFAAMRELTSAQLDKFTRLDYDRDMALIAVREKTGQTVGVARLVREGDPLVAEFAVIVQHDMQGRGLATHLMRRLLAWAPRHGVREVIGEILAENAAMIDLARHLGFSLLHLPDDPQIIKAQLNLALGLPVAHG
jgi:acetyltransferase